LASLHQQQRNEIMNNVLKSVNKKFELSFSPTALEAFNHLPRNAPFKPPFPLPSRSSNREGTKF
ncbi:hypothetical protein, partial [Caballeronia sp. LZ035]|uniref:hypothetical protein n=1 Tax=Caballeronia sp. LZ035 TaxID=3038568 RepID=UPI002865A410